jgi:hypothetical protein
MDSDIIFIPTDQLTTEIMAKLMILDYKINSQVDGFYIKEIDIPRLSKKGIHICIEKKST